MKFLFAGALLAASAYAEAATHAAVIVAGSTGYYNYRHQADAAHAYQVMIKQGVAPENIILMMYDDVANSYQNPFRGQLYNHPQGDNVYDQSVINYSGQDVTVANFIAVLQNDADSATGPVLNTDANTKIFVNFVDHGATGFICFPYENMYADQIQNTIDYMETNSLYGEMVWYIEACESGSMFPNLGAHQNVYAMTASDADQSSWASYCPPNDFVGTTAIGTCMGDLFSTNWMEDSETHNSDVEKLAVQHYRVKLETDLSPVCEFGDMGIKAETVGEFQGDGDVASIGDLLQANIDDQTVTAKAASTRWNSRDVKYLYLANYVETHEDSHEEMHQLQVEIEHREKEAEMFNKVFGEVEDMVTQPLNFDCLRTMVNGREEHCGKFSDYSLQFVKHFVHVCETEPASVGLYMQKMVEHCATDAHF